MGDRKIGEELGSCRLFPTFGILSADQREPTLRFIPTRESFSVNGNVFFALVKLADSVLEQFVRIVMFQALRTSKSPIRRVKW